MWNTRVMYATAVIKQCEHRDIHLPVGSYDPRGLVEVKHLNLDVPCVILRGIDWQTSNETVRGILTIASRDKSSVREYAGGEIKRMEDQMKTCPVSVLVAPAEAGLMAIPMATRRDLCSARENTDTFYIQIVDVSPPQIRGKDHQVALLTTYFIT